MFTNGHLKTERTLTNVERLHILYQKVYIRYSKTNEFLHLELNVPFKKNYDRTINIHYKNGYKKNEHV